MVRLLKSKDSIGLNEFLKNYKDKDFYFTEKNNRFYINNIKVFKRIKPINPRILEEKGEILGIIFLWKSIGNNITRYYIKLNAINKELAKKLLDVCLWNEKRELFIKINKKSPLLQIFKEKNFRFLGDRGREILFFKDNKINLNKEKTNGEYNISSSVSY